MDSAASFIMLLCTSRKRNRAVASFFLITLATFVLLYLSTSFKSSSSQSAGDDLNDEILISNPPPSLVHTATAVLTTNEALSLTSSNNDAPIKTILYWTGLFASSDMYFGFGQEPFIRAGCKVTNCIATADRTKMNESDAIIFHFHKRNFNLSDLPTHRKPEQRYVFFAFESLAHDLEFPFPVAQFSNRTANFFNWTMTHRRDSDVHNPMIYGTLRRKKTSPIEDQFPPKLPKGVRPEAPAKLMDPFATAKERLKKKAKLVAWFCSHKDTHGMRQEYFTQLSNHIPLDIYGSCANNNLTCPFMSHECNVMLDTYKFYISAENSFCPDYVTEKFYRALSRDVVPIVYGGADYSQFAPPHSYINVADFKSPKDLANYLLLLHNNDALYVRHFEWKRDWEVQSLPSDGFCDLCERLNNPSERVKSYADLGKWWHHDVPCFSGSSFFKQPRL